ncbi:MAG: 4-diphosphocytidyl-2C-methyl-D-erythritol kinase [Candidatus Peregrinibacteria bacterium GW2011_GWE2_39_6]|nr:MAG: 4-diphosphocytidyl-2C-methyl-D-erythritol kinase [Candidatus Peregrinibacteria bacterium GW2011_GWF2_39_17]KKR26273.1 MAG: 4-diphosphocytidyl-2C-methyl-D-erythritol kinase [Candidatus Peregrinibacteria bacterium GW2011_GWE2_39_6]HCW32413.1 4-(cytidine 5'-diphospho)-2-C-methyl-D-erythritol kinase [Candidatus Peregrinibacteria bacterium]
MKILSPAKINLTLDVLKKDFSGYHQITTIYHEVSSLTDELNFDLLKRPCIEFYCDHPNIPLNEENTIYQAAKLLQKKYSQKKGVKIRLQKNIPICAGLGGSSSNAATTLKALNKLWQLNLSVEQLLSCAAKIGMDVPFFILGGAAIGSHYGEILTPLPVLLNHQIEIIRTNIPVSTQNAYEGLNLSLCGKNQNDTLTLIRALKKEARNNIEQLLHNDFEKNFFANYPEIKKNYPKAHLSGTGGALFQLIPVK